MTFAAATELATATNEHLANISNTLIYSSMAVYTLAFFAYIAEWLLGSRSKVGRTAAALTADAKAKSQGKVPPAVTVNQGGSTAVLERPQVVVRSAAGSRDVPDGPGAHGGDEQGDLYGRIAISLTVLAFLVELAGVVARAASVERAPWGNMYEFNITFSTVAVAVYLGLLALKKDVRWLGLFLVTTVLLDLGLAVTVLYTASDQLVPALHSYWLYIHVSTAIFCGAVFYVGAVATILYLFKDSYENKIASGGTPAGSRTPSSTGCPPPRASTSSPTASTRPSSRCGRSRSSRARSGRATRGAATGAGTPRRPGRSSPGSPTPATCTPAPPPAGRAARPPTWRCSPSAAGCSTITASTSSSPASTPTPASEPTCGRGRFP